MAAPKRGPWIAGAVVVSLLIGGAGWTLGISPQLEVAKTAREDAETARAQNAIHAQRLAILEEQFAELDTYKAELAGLRTQIPADDGVREMLTQIEASAEAAGIFKVGSTFGLPTRFVERDPVPPVDPALAAAAPAETTAPAEGAAAPGTAETPAPAATPAPTDPAAPVEAAPAGPSTSGVVVIPVDITVLGSFPATVAFIREMQKDTGRLFLVTGYRVVGQKPGPPSGGKPEIRQGDAETVVSGYMYVLESSVDAAAQAAAAANEQAGVSDT